MKLLAMESRWEFAEGVVCEEITRARAVCRVGKKAADDVFKNKKRAS